MPAKRKKALSRKQIVAAAISQADEEGLGGLSMRSLAKSLGYGVMSLYNHVQDKDDLLDAMVDRVAATIELPSPSSSSPNSEWRDQLRRCAISAYKVMLTHRWLAGVWGRWPGHAKNQYHEALLRVMRQANFPEQVACQGYHALTMHVVGFAGQVLEMPVANGEELRSLARRSFDELDPEEFPYLREHIRFHLDGRDQRSDFKYMLDLILDGLERELAQES